MLQEIYRNAIGYRAILIAILALILLEGVLAGMSIGTILPAGEAILSNGPERPLPWPLSEMRRLTDGDPSALLTVLGVLMLLKSLASFARELLGGHVKRRLWQRWTHDLVHGFLSVPYKHWLGKDPGVLINLSVAQMSRAVGFFMGYVAMVSQIITFLALVFVAALVDWRAVFSLGLLALLTYILVLRPLHGRAFSLGQRAVEYSRQLTDKLTETVMGAKEIRLLDAVDLRTKEIDGATSRAAITDFVALILRAIPKFGLEAAMATAVIAAGLWVSLEGDAALRSRLPEILFFVAVFVRLAVAGAEISAARIKLTNRYPSFLAVTGEAARLAGARESDEGTKSIANISHGVIFQDIDFSHHPGNKVLNKLNLEIPANSIVFLFGPSGSGKSTLADLLARLYRPDGGAILAEGQDIRVYRLADWRRVVGYVSQQPVLFSGSVLDNIKAGTLDCTDEYAKEIARIAGVSDFVERLADGYDTDVGEQGRFLSGGQKCRIAIARSLVRQPSLLILDEALSQIEVPLERDILERLRRIDGLTVLNITHRAANNALADLIVNIEAGRLDEMERVQQVTG